MLVICGGALAIGAAASLALPFAPFALALTPGAAVGAILAALAGLTAGRAALSALAILAAAQIGYGLGLLADAALSGLRRDHGPRERPKAAKSAGSSPSGPPFGDER